MKSRGRPAAGGAASVAAGRLAYAFGLTGAAAAVDTACSSALVAAHMAARELAAGAAARALAAGVSLTLGAAKTAAFAVTGHSPRWPQIRLRCILRPYFVQPFRLPCGLLMRALSAPGLPRLGTL